MKNTKLNNKGFSLVELIIVIAIMAILAAALAPQLIKYIEKSRVSTDKTSCAAIKSAFDSAVADEEVYKEVVAAGSSSVTITDASDVNSACSSIGTAFADTMEETLTDLKAPKSSGSKNYVLEWEVDDDGNIKNITYDTDNHVMSK